VSREALERVAGPVDLPGAAPAGETPRPAPGMIERHYAPLARLHRFSAHERAGAWARIADAVRAGERVGLLAFDPSGSAASCTVPMPRDAAGYARALYAALHSLDDAECTVAFVEAIPAGAEWDAIADRLRRAGLRAAGGAA
ncbi:MAG: Sua5 family C-terminal domain-containing protein, partial [Gemmatimonadota bacterium]